MNTRRIIYLGLGIGILAALLMGYGLTPSDDFSTRNTGWNGLSEFESDFGVTELSGLDRLREGDLVASDSVLFIIGPDEDFTEEESREIEAFVEDGGRVVLMDDFGSGNDLLEGLGVEMRFSGSLLVDPLFHTRNSRMAEAPEVSSSSQTQGVSSIAFNYGTTLSNAGSGEVLASSSSFSHPSEDDSRMGPFPVMVRVDRGEGSLIAVSDASPLINGMLDRENNRALASNLKGSREAYLDTSHWDRSNLVRYQDLVRDLHGFLSATEVKYGVLALLIAIIFKFGWKGGEREGEKEREDIEDIMNRHPDWDRETLERLKEEGE